MLMLHFALVDAHPTTKMSCRNRPGALSFVETRCEKHKSPFVECRFRSIRECRLHRAIPLCLLDVPIDVLQLFDKRPTPPSSPHDHWQHNSVAFHPTGEDQYIQERFEETLARMHTRARHRMADSALIARTLLLARGQQGSGSAEVDMAAAAVRRAGLVDTIVGKNALLRAGVEPYYKYAREAGRGHNDVVGRVWTASANPDLAADWAAKVDVNELRTEYSDRDAGWSRFAIN